MIHVVYIVIILAVATSKHDVVRLFLCSGVDINQTDKVNKSPLHAAVYQGNTNMVRLLIKNGANINIMDKHGRTPLLLASKHGRYEEGKCLIKGEYYRWFVIHRCLTQPNKD